jgi:hypothetical protein
VCKQVTRKTEFSTGGVEAGKEVTYITCGFWCERAGRCSVGLLADGLQVINEKADRIASAAEAIYAAMDPEDEEE